MNSELELSLVDKIWETHLEATILFGEFLDKGRGFLLKGRECGIFLLKAKETIGHGHFLSWFNVNFESNAQHAAYFSFRTAQDYMRLGRATEEDLKDATSIRQAIKTIKSVESGEKLEPINRDPDGTNWIPVFDKINIRLSELLDARPLLHWPEDEKAILRERIRPVAMIFVEAGGKL